MSGYSDNCSEADAGKVNKQQIFYCGMCGGCKSVCTGGFGRLPRLPSGTESGREEGMEAPVISLKKCPKIAQMIPINGRFCTVFIQYQVEKRFVLM